MTFSTGRTTQPVGYHVDAPAENLVFSLFRCWMAGYATGDVACWDIAWDTLRREMPLDNAKALFGEFHHFMRSLRDGARREIGWRPASCRALCHDECLVLAMLDAVQRNDRVQLLEALASLLDADELNGALAATNAFGRALARNGLFITPITATAFDRMRRAAPQGRIH